MHGEAAGVSSEHIVDETKVRLAGVVAGRAARDRELRNTLLPALRAAVEPEDLHRREEAVGPMVLERQ